LVAIERPEEGEVAAINESFAYDGTGLIASRTTGATTEHLTWDPEAPLPLLLSDGQRSYIYGPNDQPIEQVSSEEAPSYLHSDQLGTTRLLTDGGGEVTGTFSYGPYGNLIGASGSETTPMGFAGQYTDSASGLQYLRARFYDPATGQFLTRDPLEGLTREPYAYASDDPVNLTDPSGENPAAIACGVTIEIPIVGEATCGAAVVTTVAGVGAAVVGGLVSPESTSEDDVIEAPSLSKSISESRSNRKSGGREKGCDGPDGGQLRRESEAILGRGHNPARTREWNEWWKTKSPAEKKAHDSAGGPRPKKRN
jgi:RHS repeat-associated protein